MAIVLNARQLEIIEKEKKKYKDVKLYYKEAS